MNLNEHLEKLREDENYINIIKNKLNFFGNKNSKYILKNIIQFTKKNNLINAYSLAAFNLAKIYAEESEYECADLMLEELYELFSIKNNINGVIDVITGFMATKFMSGKYVESIEWGLKGLELVKEYNDIERLLIIKNNMCAIYMETGQYLKAIKILDKIEEIPWVGSKTNKITLKLNRVFCEFMENRIDEALKTLDSIKDCINDIPALKVKWLIEKARICIKKNLYNEAKEILLQAENIIKSIDIPKVNEEIILCLADIYLYNGEYSKTIKSLKSIEKKVLKTNVLILIKDLYYKLSVAYEKIGDYENWNFYFKNYNNIEKQLLEIQEQTSIKMLDYYKEDINNIDYKKLYEKNLSLLEFGKVITNNLNKDNILNIIAEQIKSFIDYDIIYISIYDEKINNYRFELIINENTIVTSNDNIVIEDSLTKYSIRNKEVLLVNNINKEHNKYIIDYESYKKNVKSKNYSYNNVKEIKSIFIIPMIIKGKVIGTITIQKYDENFYKLNDLITLKTLANFISIALDNSFLYKKVEYNANYDSLTDIYNRRMAIEKINKVRESLQKKFSKHYIAIMDIDNFKSINDIYGHDMGDKVLVSVTKEIKKVIKEEDILGRYGGEEFILLIKDNNCDFKDTIEKIRKNIEDLNIKDLNNNKIEVTISIGVENFDLKYKTLEENICVADKKLYLAKNTGKNKVIF